MSASTPSHADGYVKWVRQHVGSQLIYLVYTTNLILNEEGRILVQRRYDFDWLSVPGGALERGESLHECAIREAREESGIIMQPERLVGVFSHPDLTLHYPNGDVVQQWTVCVAGHAAGGDLVADGKESLEVSWMDIAEAMPQFPHEYQLMVQAMLDSPDDAVLEPVYAVEPLRPYYPILREKVGSAPIILPGVMAVIRNDAGEVLAVRRHGATLFDVIGGYCDLGETTTAAVIREVREETGLTVKPQRIIGVYSANMLHTYPNGDAVHGVGIAFDCRITGGTLHADHHEIAEVKFMPIERLIAQPGTPGMAAMRQLWLDAQHPDQWPHLR